MPDPTVPSPSAESLFADWLSRRATDQEEDLERVCRDHPVQAQALRALQAQWARIHSIIETGDGDAMADGDPGTTGVRAALLARLIGCGETHSRYAVESEIGRGSMGAVYRVQDENLRRFLAMKVALGTGDSGEELPAEELSVRQLTRFLEEAEVTGQLDHPGIVPVHELGLDAAGRVYFTMKLVEGQTLKEVLDDSVRGEDGWTQPRVLGLLLKVCEAVSYAHDKGVIHRDLKPANVMVGRYGETYVMDWGLAKILDRDNDKNIRIRSEEAPPTRQAGLEQHDEGGEASASPLVTMDGDVVGTPAYMSPEQAAGRIAEMGPPSDVYSVGAMLYHLLTGHMPFVRSGETRGSREVWRSVKEGPPHALGQECATAPAELVAICERAMARRPSHRYANMAELAEDIRAYLEHRVVGAYRTGALAELRKWVERNTALASTIAAAAAALVIATVLYISSLSRAHAETEDALVRTRATGLASASDEVLESDTTLALLLAREAVRVKQTPETLSRLHQALGAVRERVIFPHEDAFVDAVFSPADDQVLGIANGVALLWRLDEHEPNPGPTRLEGHSAYLTSAVFSPSGESILTSSQDGTARLWDLNGHSQATFKHDDWVYTAAYSPDGQTIVTASQDGTAKLWKRDDDEKPLAILDGHTDAVRTASFSPDGEYVLTASVDATGRLWRVLEETGAVEFVAALEGHEGPIIAASFSPGGNRIVTASGIEGIWSRSGIPDDTARVWNLRGEQLAVLRGHENGVEWAVFSPDGHEILTASADQTGRLWDLEGTFLTEYRVPSNSVIWRCAFAPNGRFVAFGCADGSAWLFDVSGNVVGALSGHDHAVNSVRFSPDSRSIATASVDGTVRLWSVLDDAVPTYYGHLGGVNRAVYSPEGTVAATTSADRTVRLWDTRGNPLGPPLQDHRHTVYSVEFSPDGQQFVTASRDRTARLWDLQGNVLWVFEHGLEVQLVADASFSPGGDHIATGCRNGTVVIWDAETGVEIERFPGDGMAEGHGMIENVDFAPDGEHLLLARMYGPVLVLSLGDGTTRSLEFAGDQAEYSPGGDRILIASTDGRAVLLGLAGELQEVFGGHEGKVSWASFAPSGRRIVTASTDGTAHIWAVDGTLIATLRGHTGAVTSAVFSPLEDRVLTASSDGTARTWVVETEELMELAAERTIRSFTRAELLHYEELLGVGD